MGQGPLPDPSALDDALAGVACRVDLLVGWARDDAAGAAIRAAWATFARDGAAGLATDHLTFG